MAIRDPIGREIAEQHGLRAAGHFRHVGRDCQTVAEQLVGLALLQAVQPEMLEKPWPYPRPRRASDAFQEFCSYCTSKIIGRWV